MMNKLVPCASCSRHVRLTEAVCPFCGAECSQHVEPPPSPSPPTAATRPLSRAALLFMGAAATVGCTPAPVAVYGPAPVDERPDSGTSVTPTPPPTTDGGSSSTNPSPRPQPNPVALYGVPPIDEGEGRGP
jgi:hypothetical protein